jgi:hypothetical protein
VTQREALVQQAVSTINGQLSGGQQQVWQVARTNRAAPGRYRYLSDLSAASGSALGAAMVKYGAGSAQAQQVEQSVLGGRVSDVNTSLATIGEHILAVIAAERAVLPLPDELKTQAGTGAEQ